MIVILVFSLKLICFSQIIQKEKLISFHFVQRIENLIMIKNDYMKKMKPKHFIKTKKLICDWTDEKKKTKKKLLKYLTLKMEKK